MAEGIYILWPVPVPDLLECFVESLTDADVNRFLHEEQSMTKALLSKCVFVVIQLTWQQIDW